MSQAAYRTDIDGLRAVAVLPVILFHAGFPWASGGYVGVDVFFVISGYLITRILVTEQHAETYSVVHFYRRRFLRILPALGAVLVVSTLLAWLWMTPADLQSYSESLIAVVTMVSNIWFWSNSGYFDVQAELSPLLHIWSLSVEEQFYIVYPVMIALVWKVRKDWLFPVILLTTIVGFALSHWMVLTNPNAAYFWLPPRAWELLVGAAVATWQFNHPGRRINALISELAGWMGMAMILIAVHVFTSTTRFPGINASLPVLGTAVILFFGTPQTTLHRLLSFRPMQVVGLASYSIYLWHQPALAFARLRKLDALTLTDTIVICVASVLLGLLTWKFIELPVRRWRWAPPGRVFAASAVGAALLASVGWGVVSMNGVPSRFTPTLLAVLGTDLEEGFACTLFEDADFPPDCIFGDPDGNKSIALFGDSHAQALQGALDELFKTRGIRGVRINITQCEPIPHVTVQGLSDERFATCIDAFHQTLETIERDISGLIVSIRWTYRLYPIPGHIERLTFDNGEGGVEFDKERIYVARDGEGAAGVEADLKRGAIDNLFTSLRQTGVPIVVVHPVPETGIDIKRYNFISYLDRGEMPREISTSANLYFARNAFVEDSLNKIDGALISHVRPADTLCNTLIPERCVVQYEGVPYYSDDDHLSQEGARMVLQGNADALLPIISTITDD